MAELIGVRFKRATAMLDDTARARLYGCSSSSGSEHSVADSSLGDLVLYYLETQYDDDDDIDLGEFGDDIKNSSDDEDDGGAVEDSKQKRTKKRMKKVLKDHNGGWSDSDEVELLGSLVSADEEGRSVQLTVEAIIAAVPSLWKDKRGLMSELRRSGLDAGLCKSKWEKSGSLISGQHEYIDVLGAGGNRHIVEVDIAAEFRIARPSSAYLHLLSVFPPIYVGPVGDLKRVVTIMSDAMKRSLKSRELLMPPWRCRRYMRSKWMAIYKRTTNVTSLSVKNEISCQSKKRVVGFTHSDSNSKPEWKMGSTRGKKFGCAVTPCPNMWAANPTMTTDPLY